MGTLTLEHKHLYKNVIILGKWKPQQFCGGRKFCRKYNASFPGDINSASTCIEIQFGGGVFSEPLPSTLCPALFSLSFVFNILPQSYIDIESLHIPFHALYRTNSPRIHRARPASPYPFATLSFINSLCLRCSLLSTRKTSIFFISSPKRQLEV